MSKLMKTLSLFVVGFYCDRSKHLHPSGCSLRQFQTCSQMLLLSYYAAKGEAGNVRSKAERATSP